MMQDSGQEKDLILYRLKDAKEKLKATTVLLDSGNYKDSISRSYYASFAAARALLATKRLDSSKHSGVIALFNQHFVKEGIVSKEVSKIIENAKHYRERADYGDFFIVSRKEAQEQAQSAEKFVKEIARSIVRISPNLKNDIEKIVEISVDDVFDKEESPEKKRGGGLTL